MIYLKKNNENKFITRTNEFTTIDSPKFLFHFRNEFNKKDIYYATTDLASVYNYNLFSLTENPSGSTTSSINGDLNLTAGQYHYSLYESSVLTTSISATTGTILDQGIMVVALTRTVNTSGVINNIYL